MPERRAEERRARRPECRTTGAQLVAPHPARQVGHRDVAVRVVGDDVAAPRRFRNQLRVLGGAGADGEERGQDVEPIEQVEQSRQIARVGAVVERDRGRRLGRLYPSDRADDGQHRRPHCTPERAHHDAWLDSPRSGRNDFMNSITACGDFRQAKLRRQFARASVARPARRSA